MQWHVDAKEKQDRATERQARAMKRQGVAGEKPSNVKHRNGTDPQRQSMEQIRLSSVWRGQS